MHGVILFACPMCALSSPFFFALSFSIGGVLVSYGLLRPFAARVSERWGWPRLDVSSVLALASIFVWPCFFGWMGAQTYTPSRVATGVTGIAFCAVYLWLRGAWLLDQCRVSGWFRRFLFLGILGPGLLIAGLPVGQALVGLVFLGLVWPSAALLWFLTHVCVGAFIGTIVYSGLCCVFCVEDGVESRAFVASEASPSQENPTPLDQSP